MITYDLIGRGRSVYPTDNSFDGTAHVKQLRDLVKHLELNRGRRYHIIAHSMGGAITALYASENLDEVASLVLMSPAGLMDLGPLGFVRRCPSCVQAIVKRVIASGQEQAWRSDFVSHEGESFDVENAFVGKLRDINVENPRMFDAFWQSALQFPLSGIDDCVEKIASCTHISVLLMWGSLDSAVTYEPNFFRWQNLLGPETNKDDQKVISYVTYDNMGHGFLLENPKVAHNDILEFLNMQC